MKCNVRIYSALGVFFTLMLCGPAFGQDFPPEWGGQSAEQPALGLEPAEQPFVEQEPAEPQVTEPQFIPPPAEPQVEEPDIPLLAAPSVSAPPPAPPVPAEKTPRRKSAKNYIATSPGFLIINTALGFALGSDGIKKSLNENLETQVNDVYVISEIMLKAKGKATVTDIKSSGFGFTLQYERQLLDHFALMGRFSYSGLGMSLDFKDRYPEVDYTQGSGCVTDRNGKCLENTDKFSIDLDYFNWSFEVHSRYYPRAGGSLFLDGVIGFGGAGMTTKKDHVVEEDDYVVRTSDGFTVKSMEKTVEIINVPAKRGYMTIGPMFGWREVFGKKYGDLIWETSFGYLAGIGFSKSLSDKTIDGNVALPDLLGEYGRDIDDALKGSMGLIESLMVVGGPRFRMTVGWGF